MSLSVTGRHLWRVSRDVKFPYQKSVWLGTLAIQLSQLLVQPSWVTSQFLLVCQGHTAPPTGGHWPQLLNHFQWNSVSPWGMGTAGLLPTWVSDSTWCNYTARSGWHLRPLGKALHSSHSLLMGRTQCDLLEVVSGHPELLCFPSYKTQEDLWRDGSGLSAALFLPTVSPWNTCLGLRSVSSALGLLCPGPCHKILGW